MKKFKKGTRDNPRHEGVALLHKAVKPLPKGLKFARPKVTVRRGLVGRK